MINRRAAPPPIITAETLAKTIVFLLALNLGMVAWWFNATNGKLDKMSSDFAQAREESKTLTGKVETIESRVDKLETKFDQKSASRDAQIDTLKDQVSALKLGGARR